MTPRPPRLRRILLSLGACWLILSTAWLARRWHAVTILDHSAPAAQNAWVTPSWLPTQLSGKWRKVWPSSHLDRLEVDCPADGQALAWATRVCGPPRNIGVISIGKDLHETRAFLRHLGTEPNVQTLCIVTNLTEVRVPRAYLSHLDDSPRWPFSNTVPDALQENEIDTLLLQFPQLRRLEMSGHRFSGARFPTLPTLESVFIHVVFISDEGLAAILRCPSLRDCYLGSVSVTAAGLRQVPQWKQPALKKLQILPDLSNSECLDLEAMLETACPDVRFKIDPSRW